MSLVIIFGGVPAAKVIDFFRINQFWDYSLKDIAKETGVCYRTLQKTIPRLVKLRIISYTRTEGKAKLYMFERESPLAKHLQTAALLSDLGPSAWPDISRAADRSESAVHRPSLPSLLASP